MRLIQRFGRIDRLGSDHENINLHNMLPDTQVDAELALTDRLHNRIQSFHDLIGLDSALLSDAHTLLARGRRTETGFRMTLSDSRRTLDERVFA